MQHKRKTDKAGHKGRDFVKGFKNLLLQEQLKGVNAVWLKSS